MFSANFLPTLTSSGNICIASLLGLMMKSIEIIHRNMNEVKAIPVVLLITNPDYSKKLPRAGTGA